MAIKTPSDKALREFSAAFERLKNNNPVRLIPGARVSQNNVAREAGKDVADLKKSLYPGLVQAIKDWVASNYQLEYSTSSPITRIRRENTVLAARIATLEEEVEQLRRERERYLADTIVMVSTAGFKRASY